MNEILNKIDQQKARHGERMQSGCNIETIRRVAMTGKKTLNVDIPEAYLAFLKRTNGLDWNGTIFFAAEPSPYRDNPEMSFEGIIEANRRL